MTTRLGALVLALTCAGCASCPVSPEHGAAVPASRRTMAFRVVIMVIDELTQMAWGRHECGSTDDIGEYWEIETLPLAAVAAGVDPRWVAAEVLHAAPTFDGSAPR